MCFGCSQLNSKRTFVFFFNNTIVPKFISCKLRDWNKVLGHCYIEYLIKFRNVVEEKQLLRNKYNFNWKFLLKEKNDELQECSQINVRINLGLIQESSNS